ncbi:hypothetical protein PUNSTDRAFT_95422 [Punctularia strigosozonata HHB-11173 SS5]|uniref:uncharacterized protein n=1 Tax=Punctularia strigosozonata (strain HHB-11173) TaxID=741275 RepID=UPI000441828E|nr:uncharacterized protein PUNSTDRAFT_95422 [Punctularia strigosozonata HHB-11173 SS5]EIN13971.1 hypothetical protein PUNSTDRAFT_95422 [Punctularia strigosozonata HHB-11173 SS5]
MRPFFNHDVNQGTISSIVHSFCKSGHFRQAWHWLRTMHEDDHRCTPSLDQWHTLLMCCADARADTKLMHSIIRDMASIRRPPSNLTYRILIHAMMKTNPRVREISELISEMREAGLTYDSLTLSALYDEYMELGLPSSAGEIERIYRDAFDLPDEIDTDPSARTIDQIAARAARRNIQAAIAFASSTPDFKPSLKTLLAVLSRSPTVRDLTRLEKAWEIEGGARAWSFLIKVAISKGDIRGAQAIYDQSKSRGVVPDVRMVHQLIRAISSAHLMRPSDSSLRDVFALYKDLAHAHPPGGPPSPHGPDAAIYNDLLRAIASSSDPQQYFATAVSLVKDMHLRRVPLDSMTLAQLTVVFMRVASDFEDAFEIYRFMRTSPTASFDARGFLDVLSAFCRLPFGIQPPSLSHYFDMVQDMIQDGHEIIPQVYSFPLVRIAQLATRVRKTPQREDELHALGALRHALRQTHQHLTLDASVTPDIALWNQLMDAYQKVGNITDAYNVWEMMYLRGSIDSSSVSIIMDACGFGNRGQLAKTIWEGLRSHRFPLNVRNWNAYIECLCRCGWLDEAITAFCVEMAGEGSTAEPDVETADALLKFARASGRGEEILDRIRNYLPQLWTTLPERMKSTATDWKGTKQQTEMR